MTATAYRLADEPRRLAEERGSLPALSDGQRSLTYAELDERTSRIATALIADGVRPGSRIGILEKSSVEVVEIVLGAAKAGAVSVPLNWRLTAAELASVLRDAGAEILFAGEDFVEVTEGLETALSGAGRVLVIGKNGDYESWVESQPPTDPGHRGEADEVVLQLYTSGTTGAAKGVLSTNTNLGACTASGGPWGFDGSSVSLCAMPMFHIGGLGWALVGMANGAHNVIVREVVPRALLDTIVDEAITNVFLVPAVIQMLVDLPEAASRDYSALRSIAYGSSPITPALLRRALETFGRPFFQLYGLTETHGAITQLAAEDHDPGGPREFLLRTAGRPYPWVELKTVHPESGQQTLAGEPGEICIRSLQVTPGYHNRPEETEAAIDASGWFHTGDIGSLDTEGYLTISDRLKDLIITGGENVSAIEVEAVLSEHPAVQEVAVIGRPDEKWGEAVTAVVVLRPGALFDTAALLEFSRTRLAGYKCPKWVEVVESMPRNTTGKILKRVLRETLNASR